jgi:type III restriction enzyme
MTSALQTPHDPMALSTGLTARARQLCLGLESGAADILDLVTPTTAELLLWWFGEDMVLARGGSATGGAELSRRGKSRPS